MNIVIDYQNPLNFKSPFLIKLACTSSKDKAELTKLYVTQNLRNKLQHASCVVSPIIRQS